MPNTLIPVPFVKHSARLLILSLSAILMISCGDTKPEAVACVFPDAPDKTAPGWVCDEPVQGIAISAVGSAERSGAGHDFMKTMAATSARVTLAQAMKVEVRNMIKQYVEATGSAESETVDKVLTSVTKQITNETLVGTRIFKTHKSPGGHLYVLLGMDQNSIQQATEKALRTSMNNDTALWQQFKAQKGQDELAAEISNTKARP